MGAFFGCRGDGGFNGRCSGVIIGDGGFNGCCSGVSIGDGGFNGRCSGASIGDGGFMLACISGCRGVIGFKVAMSRVLCAKKFALLGPSRTRARKSSPSARKMAQNLRFMACWANYFANIPLDGARWANYFAPVVAKVVILTDSSSNRAVL